MRDIRNDLEERASIIQEPRFFTLSKISIGEGQPITRILQHEERRIVAAKQKPDVAPGPTLGPVYKVLQAAVG